MANGLGGLLTSTAGARTATPHLAGPCISLEDGFLRTRICSLHMPSQAPEELVPGQWGIVRFKEWHLRWRFDLPKPARGARTLTCQGCAPTCFHHGCPALLRLHPGLQRARSCSRKGGRCEEAARPSHHTSATTSMAEPPVLRRGGGRKCRLQFSLPHRYECVNCRIPLLALSRDNRRDP